MNCFHIFIRNYLALFFIFITIEICNAESNPVIIQDQNQITSLNQDIEQRKKMIQCIVYADLSLQRYIDLVDSFTIDDGNPTFAELNLNTLPNKFNKSLNQNIFALFERNEQFRIEFEELLQLDTELTPGSDQDFKTQMTKLNSKVRKINNFLIDTSRIETLVLFYMSYLKQQLLEVRLELVLMKQKLLDNRCDIINVDKPFDINIRMVDNWITDLNHHANFIAVTQNPH